jgi:valyl-tRNA synthetase
MLDWMVTEYTLKRLVSYQLLNTFRALRNKKLVFRINIVSVTVCNSCGSALSQRVWVVA